MTLMTLVIASDELMIVGSFFEAGLRRQDVMHQSSALLKMPRMLCLDSGILINAP
jgi:hypothetical protein